MFKNYLIIGWRNICRRPFYSLLNMAGLTTGLLFTFLIAAYVWTEYRVNKSLPNLDCQYFLQSNWKDQNEGTALTTTGPLAQALRTEYPHLIANYYRGDFITTIVSKGDKHLREGVDIGDSTLLGMYGFKLLHGDARTAMNEPFSVVIRKEVAIKYFGRTDVVGQTIGIQNFLYQDREFLITGVLDDIPENSVTDLNIENHHKLFIPANTAAHFNRLDRNVWDNMFFPSFIELQKGASLAAVNRAIDTLIQKHLGKEVFARLAVRPISLERYYLERDNRHIERLIITLIIAGIFTLVMAIVNFVNISITGSSVRIREIGVRKVFGGSRKGLIIQFLTESMIFVFLAMLAVILLYPLVRPAFENMVGKPIPSLYSFPTYFALFPPLVVLIVGVAAGLYPAFVLSSVKAVDSIKGQLKSIGEKIWMRKILVGAQFSIAGIVMISAFIVTSQINYFFGKDLGYNKEYVVTSQLPREWTPEGIRKMEVARDQFARMPEVLSASVSYEIPDGMNGGQGTFYRVGQDSSQQIAFQIMACDEYFLNNYQVPMKAGHFFDAANARDSTLVVINEAAANALGWQDIENVPGRQVKFPNFAPVCTIIGVSGDYHFFSMAKKIPPMVFMHIRLFGTYRYMTFKVRPDNVSKNIEAIGKRWTSLLPGSTFEYRFMEDTLKRVYESELRLKRAAYIAMGISLLMVLLGIIGLVSLSIRKRFKEIGIRKVLGASLNDIAGLFVKDFVWALVIAGLVACPLAWVVMNNWLDNYAYRINIGLAPFIIALLLIGALTSLLVVLQSWKARNASPVNSLKSE